jgi:hypothetical protein
LPNQSRICEASLKVHFASLGVFAGNLASESGGIS